MAGFKTHITFSSILGVGYGTAAYCLYDIPLPSCILAGGLCGVSGMLPDLDSGPGVPLRESMAFAAAVVPMLLVHHFQAAGWSYETIALAGAAIYLLVRFGGTHLLQLLTDHRGMFHSIPTALIFGELAYLAASGDEVVRAYKAGAVIIGFMSHLFLDEVYSVQWSGGKIGLKSSFGTALKFFGHSWGANLVTFTLFAAMTFAVVKEPNWLQNRIQSETQMAGKIERREDAKNSSDLPATKKISQKISEFFNK